jgi:V8-like Glu-specific endopeptidase
VSNRRLLSRGALARGILARGVLAAALLGALGGPVAAATGCAVELDPVAGAAEAIAGGVRETGYPSVVFLYNLAGSACTASIIAPRVVLTAKHCVRDGSRNRAAPARNFRVGVGSSARSLTAIYEVSEVRAAPGSWDIEDGSDVAVLILASPARETPLRYSKLRPNALGRGPVKAVGYGQLPDGSSGTKFSVSTAVDGLSGNFIFVQPSVCSGDSGGPALDVEDTIWGVASFIYSPDGRTQPRCGTAPGAYASIHPYLGFIEQAIEDSGTCIPDGAEVCNGEDDDCDGEVDEGCKALGQPCATSDECVGGLCDDTSIGRVCTRPCSPLDPGVSCGPGFYCTRTAGCDGRCVPGVAGAAPIDAACAADTDCASLFCVDPGDGRRRCLAPCQGDAGTCFEGEVCAAPAGACGACVPAAIVAGARGLGEPCATGADCGSGLCRASGGSSYCTRSCATDGECATGFRCLENQCHRGLAEAVGGPCLRNEDCVAPGLCAMSGGRSWCTTLCTDDASCPSGFTCVDAGGVRVCAPALGLVGARCTSNEECTTGLCELGAGVCTRFCSEELPCGAGFVCRRLDADRGVCVSSAPPAARDDGGCAVSAPRAAASSTAVMAARHPWRTAALALGAALALTGIARRRRRARSA